MKMKKIYPPFEEIQLLDYLLGKAGREERGMIEEWIGKDEANREYVDQLEKIWVETGKIRPEPVAVDVDEAWERMLSRISGEEKGPTVRSIRYVWTVAAILLVSFGVYFVAKMFIVPSKQLILSSATAVLTDTLSDGTTIALNTGSKLYYPERFARKKREVRLEGEAFFKVKPDAAKPFIIEAGAAMIKVLGTSFNVKAYSGSDVEVSVEEGLVMLYSVDPGTGDTLSVLLPAGTRGVLPLSSNRPEILKDESPDRLFWLDRTLEFRQTELSSVFSILAGHFGITIRADRPEILNCRLSATFRDESLATILDVIATSFDLTLKNEGSTWIFYGNGCTK